MSRLTLHTTLKVLPRLKLVSIMTRGDQRAAASTRPKKGSAAPPPLLGSKHCVACGRVISEADKRNVDPTPRKYCSQSCRKSGKPPSSLALAFHKNLTEPTARKDAVVMCHHIEQEVFGETEAAANVPTRPVNARELARRSARLLVGFGFSSQGVEGETRSVEAVQSGQVVESSFAKGDWGIRWTQG